MLRRKLAAGIASGLVAATMAPLQPGIVGADPAEPVIPIPHSVWLYEVDATALPETRFLLEHILEQLRPVNRRRMLDVDVRVHIIPQDRDLTELPLWAGLRGLALPDINPSDNYQETRTYDNVRGLGPSSCRTGPLNLAVGEELIVALAPGGYESPSVAALGWSLVHEIGHAIECSLTADQRAQLLTGYQAARQRPYSEVVGIAPTYTMVDQREYFAEGVAAWFEAGPDDSYRRAWLVAHDPQLHQLMSEVFVVPPEVPTCASRRATAVLGPGGHPFLGSPGPDVIVGSPAADVINGGGDDDVICGGDGDDTLVGSAGADHLDGGDGADDLVDTTGADLLVGGSGDDSLDSRDAAASSPDDLDGSEGVDACRYDGDDRATGCESYPPTAGSSSMAPTSTTTTEATTTVSTTSTPPTTSAPDTPRVSSASTASTTSTTSR